MTELLQIQEPRPSPARPQWRATFELGFRPLYPLACAWAAISVALWVFMPQWLTGTLPGLAWHAHEMLWGFVATVAVGFLLTAGANWTGINPLHGTPLAATTGLWLVARIAFLLPGSGAFWLGAACELLFFLIAAAAIARAVHRGNSRRNLGVAPALLGLAPSDAAYLWAVWQGDYAAWSTYLQTGLCCMAMLAVLVSRRVIPFFASRAIAGLEIPMLAASGRVQLVAVVIAVPALLLDWRGLGAAMLALAGGLALFQVLMWKPWRVWRVPLLWVLYLGYAGLGIGLLLAAWQWNGAAMRAALPIHVIGMAGFAVLIIGMVTRTALGHLGRPLRTDAAMVTCYVLVILATIARIWALLWPGTAPLHISATFWFAAFALYVWRFVPMLIRPRIDQPGGVQLKVPVKMVRADG